MSIAGDAERRIDEHGYREVRDFAGVQRRTTMRKIIASEFVTVDGVMESANLWNSPFWSDEIMEFKLAELFAVDALLLGRVTYDIFAPVWPSQSDEAGYADRMNSIPKYVVSTTLQTSDWNNTTIISSDVAAEVAKLKEEPGQDILIFGSAELIDLLADNGLIDEYRLMTFPVVVGSGKRVFKEGRSKLTLELGKTTTLPNGVTVASYHPAAEKV
jgi:dihydrofolate reductase